MITKRDKWILLAGFREVETFAGSGSPEHLLLIATTGLRRVRIRGTVAGSALTGLKVRKGIVAEQTLTDYFVNADLDSPMNMLPYTSKTSGTPSLYLTPAGSSFEFEIDVACLSEIGISVTSAGAGSVSFDVKAADN